MKSHHPVQARQFNHWFHLTVTFLFIVGLLAGPAWPSAVGAWGASPARPAAILPLSRCAGRETLAHDPIVQGWDTAEVDAVKSFRQMSDRNLALDPQGRPHIAYGEYSLFYTHYDADSPNGVWHLEVVDPGTGLGRSAALQIDPAGHPHISYYDYTLGRLKYAHYDGTSWHTEAVDDIGSC